MNKPFAYIGIDPGMKGSIVCIYEEGNPPSLKLHVKKLENATPSSIWDFLNSWSLWQTYAVIEQQNARPTRWFDKTSKRWQSTVLRSTVILYGSYMQLKSMLTASHIPHEDCPPKRWQKTLNILSRKARNLTDAAWKRQLKIKAQQLYPAFSQEITLQTADALLLSHYCREKRLMYTLSNGPERGRQFHEEQE